MFPYYFEDFSLFKYLRQFPQSNIKKISAAVSSLPSGVKNSIEIKFMVLPLAERPLGPQSLRESS